MLSTDMRAVEDDVCVNTASSSSIEYGHRCSDSPMNLSKCCSTAEGVWALLVKASPSLVWGSIYVASGRDRRLEHDAA
eukprot:130806-Chlamydomonas_euryale.AAC.7